MHVANDSDVYQYNRGYVLEEEYDYMPNYTILSEEDILERQNETITAVSELLYISKADARFLLRHFKWNVGKISDEWFANEEKVRMDVGLLEKPVVEVEPYEEELKCMICFDSFQRSSMKAASCGQHHCNVCWTGYIHASINAGPGCLSLRCMDTECKAAVGEDMVLSLVTDEDRAKYTRWV